MVRRVGFGNTPKPEKPRKPRTPLPKDTQETRPMPAQPKPAAIPEKAMSTEATRPGGTLSAYKVAKIVIAILLAIRIESTIVSVILIFWVGKEIWSLSRAASNTASRRK